MGSEMCIRDRLILAPVIRGRKGEFKKDFAEYRKKGFQRVKIDGEVYDLNDTPALDKNIKHDIEGGGSSCGTRRP